MITIEIKKAKRIKDFDSAFLSFNYDENIISYLRRLPVRFYFPETKQWEIPLTTLENFKTIFSNYQIQVIDTREKLTKEQQTVDENLVIDYEFKTKPFDHQMWAIQYGMMYDNWFLGDEMGLGKTKTAIDIACARKHKFNYEHCLIVCGVNTLKWNWVNEIHTHSNEDGWILGQRTTRGKVVKIGSTKDKLTDLQHLFDNPRDLPYFIITNIESFRDKDIADTVKKLCEKDIISMCVFDEAHKCKNPQSQQTKGFIKCQPKVKIAMTGTPIMNSPLDLFIILKWLGFENHSYTAFKNHYCILGGFGGYEVLGYKNVKELTDSLQDIMVRRLKTDVFDLPEKTYIEEYVEMLPKQEILYKEVKANIMSNIDMIDKAIDPLASLIRLRQVTGYPGILSSEIQESAKLDRLEDLVDEAIINGQKVVIFSNWTQMTGVILNRLSKKHNGVLITGDTKDYVRQLNVEDFQNDPECKFILGTIGAMGTGLTLTAGTVVIFVDEPWNKALFDQAVDRCHRVGTTNNITIYSLMCKGTIDERVHELIYKKGAMSDAIVDSTKMTNTEIFNYLLT